MAMSAPRSSVFTFESTVHSAHVLCRLDEQRRRDILCDVTVVVECQSFRAHRAVLASCSEYFSQRLSALAQHGAVISLPQEVTVTGFEPLLKFAYTSKLLFGKDSVLDVRNAASILGFRDLDEACFDFLLPKFFSSSKSSVACPRMTCCERKYKRHLSKAESPTDSDVVLLDEKEEKPVADSPFQQEAAQLCKKSSDGKRGSQNDRGALTPGAEGLNETFVQCPKYRKFQLACGKDACVTERSLNNLATVVRDDCNLSCSPNSSRNETEVQIPSRRSNCEADEPWETEVKEEKTEDGVAVQEVKQDKNYVVKMEEDATGVDSLDTASVEAVSLGESAVQGERSTRLILHHCPLMALAGGPAITRSLEQERFVMDLKEEKKPVDCGGQGPEAWGERHKEGQTGMSEAKEVRIMERNVESAGSLNVLDSDAGSSSDTGSGQPPTASLEWLKLHVNLSSSSSGGVGSSGVDSSGGGCPFLQDLDQSKCLWKGAGQSESEGASLSGVSSPNSGEDGESETETEGDSESYARERARQVQLPFSVDWIVDLSRNDFQQLLKQQTLTREQLDFVHDMRRRSKNRLAAQRCRKRKLDCIYNLQYEINKLKTEREKLMMEKSQLRQLKMKTCHSVSALCQRVCSESNLQPEQLQVLTKSSDCPLSSLFPHIDALLSQRGLQVQPQTSRSVCSVNPDRFEASEEALSSTGRDTREGRRSLKLHTESLH